MMPDFTSMPLGAVTVTKPMRQAILSHSDFEWAVRSLALRLTTWLPPHNAGPEWVTPPRKMGQNQ